MHPRLKQLTLVLLILVCVYSSVAYLVERIQAWNPTLITNDGVYDWDERLADLRADLPPDVTMVGYVSDWDVLPEYDYPNNETEFVLTQYSMAPIIVARNDEQEWLIVNLKPKDFETWAAAQTADIEVTKYPLGLFLVHKP